MLSWLLQDLAAGSASSHENFAYELNGLSRLDSLALKLNGSTV